MLYESCKSTKCFGLCVSKYLDFDSRKVIYNSFIAAILTIAPWFGISVEKLWNELPLDYQNLSDIDIQDLKKTLKIMGGQMSKLNPISGVAKPGSNPL